MYFKPEMITAIVEGRKTQTRRIAAPMAWIERQPIPGAMREACPIESIGYANRLKWKVGNTYAVCPGRGKPGVWWNELLDCTREWQTERPGIHNRWRPLRIHITAIRRERVTEISEEDARAEGMEPQLVTGSGPTAQYSYVANYALLWDRINTRKGTRWNDDPWVWCLSFEVVK